MCGFEAGQEEDSQTECFKPRWKTVFAMIDGSGALSAEGSSLDNSGGSQDTEDVPDKPEEHEFSKETEREKMETLGDQFFGDPLETLKHIRATGPEGSFMKSAQPNGISPALFSTLNCDFWLSSMARD